MADRQEGEYVSLYRCDAVHVGGINKDGDEK